MKKLSLISMLVALALFVGFSLVSAQEDDITEAERAEKYRAEKYDEMYDIDRFNEVDTNGDGVLDKNELLAAQRGFDYYQDEKRFRHADTNNDGVISLQEAKREKIYEMKHFEEIEQGIKEDVIEKGRKDELKQKSRQQKEDRQQIKQRRGDIKGRSQHKKSGRSSR